MKAGFGRECITPEIGVAISGYFENRNAKGVLDDLQNGPESYNYILSGLKIGDTVFLGTHGELFTEIGLRIQKESTFDNTFVCCLTNGGTHISRLPRLMTKGDTSQEVHF